MNNKNHNITIMSEICINDLYNIIFRLEEKVDKLTSEINRISKGSNVITNQPNQTMEEWLQSSTVNSKHINKLFTQENGTIKAFKDFIFSNNKSKKIPISINDKKLNLFCKEEDGENTWIQCDDDNLNQIISEIWRKFLEFHTNMPEDNTVNEDEIILQKKKLLQMRSELCDVEKTKRQIIKWLSEIA